MKDFEWVWKALPYFGPTVAAIASLIMWYSTVNYKFEVQAAAIQRLETRDEVVVDQLQSIDERLSRIEGKLDVMMRHR